MVNFTEKPKNGCFASTSTSILINIDNRKFPFHRCVTLLENIYYKQLVLVPDAKNSMYQIRFDVPIGYLHYLKKYLFITLF